MELKICHLYPDVLNLYGDRGNIICMKKRLEWRGIDCTVTPLGLGSAETLAGFDLVFIGGGQGCEEEGLLPGLRLGREAQGGAAG
ncbi:MAG: glutamine amidotransferase, partial [Oscillospiraceae bacterium]|nr:glutamine amidotransferase [Oscillospiraceae bacterium]